MQKWEYCYADFPAKILVILSTTGSRVIGVRRDKAKGDASDADALRRAIAGLGSDGWEMVAPFWSPDWSGSWPDSLYFKRPTA